MIAETILSNGRVTEGGAVSISVGIATVLLGARTVLAQLQSSPNRVWEVRSTPGNVFFAFLRHRLPSAALVINLGSLRMVSLVVGAVLAAPNDLLDTDEDMLIIWELANLRFSFTMVTVLFAMLLEFLPDAITRRRARQLFPSSSQNCSLAAILDKRASAPGSGPRDRSWPSWCGPTMHP